MEVSKSNFFASTSGVQMKYYDYLRAILLSVLLCCLIFTAAVFYQIGVPTESSRWISEIYSIKLSIANSVKTPKLTVISGSNALLGVSCELIEKETKFPCVNAGTHVGLGIDYLLKRGRSFVKSGDVVLLPLEYENYNSTGVLNNVSIDFVLSRDPQYLLSVDFMTQMHFIAGISFERLKSGIIAKFKPEMPIKVGYQSETINKYGDETRHREISMTKDHHKIVSELKPMAIKGYIKSSHGMETIQQFLNWCKKNQVKVIITWPNTVYFDDYQDKDTQDFFKSIEDFYTKRNLTVLGKPRDFMYDKSMFYDSIYHLNDRGMKFHTKQLINLLYPYLRKIANS